MNRKLLCLGLVLVFAGAGVVHSTVSAQPSAADNAGYEQLIQTALSEFDAGNFAEARALFEQAHAIRPSARTLRGLGIAAFELKHYVQARGDLGAALTDARQPLTPAQRSAAQALLDRVDHYIGRVELHVQPAEATLVLNGKPVSGPTLDLDVGDYDLRLSEPGYRDTSVTVTVEGGKTQTLTLQLVALELSPARVAAGDAASNTQAAARTSSPPNEGLLTRWWFWTAAGALVAGVVITAVALSTDPTQKPVEPGQVGVSGVVTTLRSAL